MFFTYKSIKVAFRQKRWLSLMGKWIRKILWAIFTVMILAFFVEQFKADLLGETDLISKYYMPMEESANNYFEVRSKLEKNCIATLSNLTMIQEEILKSRKNKGFGQRNTIVQPLLTAAWQSNQKDAENIVREMNISWKCFLRQAEEFSLVSGLSEEYRSIVAKKDADVIALETEVRAKEVEKIKMAGIRSTDDVVDLYYAIKTADDNQSMSRDEAFRLLSGLAELAVDKWTFNLEVVRKRMKIDSVFYSKLHALFLPRVQVINEGGVFKRVYRVLMP